MKSEFDVGEYRNLVERITELGELRIEKKSERKFNTPEKFQSPECQDLRGACEAYILYLRQHTIPLELHATVDTSRDGGLVGNYALEIIMPGLDYKEATVLIDYLNHFATHPSNSVYEAWARIDLGGPYTFELTSSQISGDKFKTTMPWTNIVFDNERLMVRGHRTMCDTGKEKTLTNMLKGDHDTAVIGFLSLKYALNKAGIDLNVKYTSTSVFSDNIPENTEQVLSRI